MVAEWLGCGIENNQDTHQLLDRSPGNAALLAHPERKRLPPAWGIAQVRSCHFHVSGRHRRAETMLELGSPWPGGDQAKAGSPARLSADGMKSSLVDSRLCFPPDERDNQSFLW